MQIQLGQKLSRYRLIEKIGEGGMGVVYRAEDRDLGRTVALKFLTAELDEVTPEARERFFREARAASALDHPNVCTVHDIGESDDGSMYLCMACAIGSVRPLRR